MLEHEIKYYNKIKDDLRTKYPEGGFVVIKDETILGVWMNRMDALKSGIDKYGNIPFLVKEISDNPSNKLNYSRNIIFTHAISYYKQMYFVL